jgi:hypothetical protein
VNTLVARYGGVRFITTHQPSLDQYPVGRFHSAHISRAFPAHERDRARLYRKRVFVEAQQPLPFPNPSF